ncbi:MAG: pantoate--beta-alanine ligase [Chloroflexi bacterium]|nr:pantoate--beta-alanine ligase [Chloroflexota bacterium]
MTQQIDSVGAMMEIRQALKGSVGVVMTMGALHEGHMSLVEAARRENETVIATIFVNPTQFNVAEDLAKYPRTPERDMDMLARAGVDYVFTPTAEQMYPPRHQTYVEVELVSAGLEGESRPGHFRGVATVVAKLLNLTRPTRAYFGQKDAQQVVVIRQMVRDLNFPTEIVVCPTQRELDGLAMSSRNVRLSVPQREAASVIHRALRTVSERFDAGERGSVALREAALAVLQSEPMAQVEYVAVCDPRTLFGIRDPSSGPILLLVAVKIGNVRLIDNALLPWSLNERGALSVHLGVAG